MTNSNSLYSAESWDKVYKAFETVNFVSYDYDSIKQSLIESLKTNYPENFNDYIESSTLIALIESFAYIAEQLAYRVDLAAHENYISTAQRKQSILKLAKLISYNPSRNTPLSGLVKITSVSCSENITDSQGNNLTNKEILWNDINNSLWKEQFNIILNRIIVQQIGNPTKSFTIFGNSFQTYDVNNLLESNAQYTSFLNGVIKTSIQTDDLALPYELVSIDIDSSGVFEKEPDINKQFTISYSNDGRGNSSDLTGYVMLLKQGKLSKTQHFFSSKVVNNIVNLTIDNINQNDVWIQEVDEAGNILHTWEKVDTINGSNLYFNTIANRKKYEITTLENDNIKISFGDGDYSDIPTGLFNIWTRASASGTRILNKNAVIDEPVTFAYISKNGTKESCTFKYSLVSALQNSSESETAESIRIAAPAQFYTQNRMVNAEDHNSFLLREPSILKIKAVNRTFAGQPRKVLFNDSSGKYQNVIVAGSDLRMYIDSSVNISTFTTSPRLLIDDVLEPMLSTPGIKNMLLYAYYQSGSPLNAMRFSIRNIFIENASQFISGIPILEKTELQGVIDRHWYGNADSIIKLDSSYLPSDSGTVYADVTSDQDGYIYDSNFKLVKKNSSGLYLPLNNTTSNTSGLQEYVSIFKRFGIRFDTTRPFCSALRINNSTVSSISTTDSLSSSSISQVTGVPETLTIEIIDDATGTFTVIGSKSGSLSNGIVGQIYDNGLYKFLIGFPSGSNTQLYIGDVFYITYALSSGQILPISIQKSNTAGRFRIIPESLILNDTYTQAFDINSPVNSWMFIIERIQDSSGGFLYWNIISRDMKLVVESPTTSFYVDSTINIIDQNTKTVVRDTIKLLRSNIDNSTGLSLTSPVIYPVIDSYKRLTSEINQNALVVDHPNSNQFQFLNFIGAGNYVYFISDAATGKVSPIEATNYIANLSYVNDVSGSYIRKLGRDSIDFMWQHYAPDTRIIDPSPTNINDIYVLTKDYYIGVLNYIHGSSNIYPSEPTSLELKNTYRTSLSSKMISDTIIMHSASVKLIFGNLAEPQLRSVFKVIKKDASKMSNDQIKIAIIDIINTYFNIDNVDFAKTIHTPELLAVIQQKLPLDVQSIVMVPRYSTNYFGDLLIITAKDHEILQSCATVDDIEIVLGYDRILLKQV